METKGNLEDTLFKLDLIRQAVVGIAHRGAHGDIQDADDETLGLERLIDDVKADLESAISDPERLAASLRTPQPIAPVERERPAGALPRPRPMGLDGWA